MIGSLYMMPPALLREKSLTSGASTSIIRITNNDRALRLKK